ncbi:hypothetical protein WJX74_002387 [Apatococcus lobatus]|uniref:Uncharacterized protein n=1 Tax=Apatococcus lobatus TaxID=904363 RepID=A0AAW1QAN9_9CHLO
MSPDVHTKGLDLPTSCFHHTKGGRRLLTASAAGLVEEFTKLLDSTPELVTYASFWKRNTCLHHAAATRNLSVLEAAAAVIQRLPKAAGTGIFNRCTASSPDGIVNQINWQGESPLMVACKSGCPRCVGFLLEMGADLLQRGGQENWNPMHFAAAHGRLPVLHLLLGNAAIIQTVSGPRAAVHVLLRNRAWVYR